MAQSTDPKALVSTLRDTQVLSSLLNSIHPSSATPTGPNGDSAEGVDPDYREKALRFLVNTVERAGSELESSEKQLAREVVDSLDKDETFSLDDLGLARSEWETFCAGLQSRIAR